MNTVNNSIYNWLNNAVAGGNSFADSGIGGADFSELLAGLSGKGGSGKDAAESLLDSLSRRYPEANFSEGAVGETPADVRDYFGDGEGDNVAIDSSAAEAVAGNPELAKTLEAVLDTLKETMGATQAADGARMQRNVMVTSITIRFSVSQISNETGETLSSNELKTAFSEMSGKLQEMARKFFGQMTYGGGVGSGPFTSLLNSGMDMFGMSPQGMWQQGAGFNFQFGASARGGLSDLMAMLTSMANNGNNALTPPAAPAEPEPAPVETPAEPAEAAAVA